MNKPFRACIGSLAVVVGLTGLARPAAADPIPTLPIVLLVPSHGTVPLHIAFPVTNLSHALIPLGAWVLLGERFGPLRAAGIVLLVAGTWFVEVRFSMDRTLSMFRMPADSWFFRSRLSKVSEYSCCNDSMP